MYKKRHISLIVLIFVLVFLSEESSSVFAEDEELFIGSEVILFAESFGEEIELFEKGNQGFINKIITTIPDDTTVELVAEQLDASDTNHMIVRYTFLDSSNNPTVYEGYVNEKYIFSPVEADNYRENREGRIVEREKTENTSEVLADKEELNVDNDAKGNMDLEPQIIREKYYTPKRLTGLALKQPVAVYSKKNRDSIILKEYDFGHELIYRTMKDSSNWYEATVYVSGKPKTGYIHSSDVGSANSIPPTTGLALSNNTPVYGNTTQNSNKLKTYPKGSKLKYRAYKKNWYKATVYINGKAQEGYIHSKDVETSLSKQTALNGVATKNNVKVYKLGSTDSGNWKSYSYGSILKYKTFSKKWYEATVIINGVKQTGYIAKNDVGSTETNLSSYAQKAPTNVYSDTTRKSKVLKNYELGTTLKYKAYNKDWFNATVYINGKPKNGYIHRTDVGKNVPNKTEYGYAKKNQTAVYTSTSTNSKKLKTYKKDTVLKYRPYNSNWFRATVIINGKAKTGYIHKSSVESTTKRVNQLKSVNNNNQLILVTSKGYKTSKATIETFERDNKGNWELVKKMSGHIGLNGFSDNKREGDKKTPTGRYGIGTGFGQVGNPGTKLPFKNIKADDVWVDDPKSSLYNTWQSKGKTSHLWNSAENMNHRLYKFGFVINYNTNQVPNKGSAIFMHGSNSYTVGCVSTPEANMIEIMKWIDPAKKPVIIQTPEENLNKY